MIRGRLLFLAGALIAWLAPAGAQLQVQRERGLTTTLTMVATHESNMLRLPDGLTPADLGLPSDQRSDWVFAPSLGFSGGFGYGLQEFEGNVTLGWNRFQEFDNYDTDIVGYRLSWFWRTGGNLDGELTVRRDESDTLFQDFIGPTGNVLTLDTQRAAANWRPRPDRRLSMLLEHLVGSNSLEVRSINDFDVYNATATAAIVSSPGNEVYLSYMRTDGEYPNRVVSQLYAIDNSYKQDNYSVGITWNPSAFTRLLARAGYVSRHYDEIRARDFSDPTWLLDVQHAFTGKTAIAARFAQDASSIDDLDRAYTISTRASVAVMHSLTHNTRLTLKYDWQRVNWAGDPQTFASGFLQLFQDARVDSYSTPTILFDWAIAPRWNLQFAQQWPSRSSNYPAVEYRSSVSQIALQYSIGPVKLLP